MAHLPGGQTGIGRSISGKIPCERPADLRFTIYDPRSTIHDLCLFLLAQFLGHKSLVTTRRYAHLYPEATEQAMTVLAKAITSTQPDRLAERAS